MQDDPREKNEIESEYYSILLRNLAWWKKRGIYVPKSDEGEEHPHESIRIKDFQSYVPVEVKRDRAVFTVTLITAIISLVGLFVLIKYTKAAFQQVSETQVANQQAKIASANANNRGNDTLKEMQNGRRPWVGIGGNGSIRMEMLADRPLKVDLAAQNFGSSPAFVGHPANLDVQGLGF